MLVAEWKSCVDLTCYQVDIGLPLWLLSMAPALFLSSCPLEFGFSGVLRNLVEGLFRRATSRWQTHRPFHHVQFFWWHKTDVHCAPHVVVELRRHERQHRSFHKEHQVDIWDRRWRLDGGCLCGKIHTVGWMGPYTSAWLRELDPSSTGL